MTSSLNAPLPTRKLLESQPLQTVRLIVRVGKIAARRLLMKFMVVVCSPQFHQKLASYFTIR